MVSLSYTWNDSKANTSYNGNVSQQAMFEVKDRAALDAMGADPNAALALAPAHGFMINNNATGEFIRPAKGGTHGFFPNTKEIQTGFVAFGKVLTRVLLFRRWDW